MNKGRKDSLLRNRYRWGKGANVARSEKRPSKPWLKEHARGVMIRRLVAQVSEVPQL